MACRGAIDLLVATISWDYRPDIFEGYDASMDGTADYLPLVDGETVTLLRVAAWLEGRDFGVAEVTGVAYGDRFSEGSFRLEVRGIELW